ncbi:uncharacterized protein V6R79_019053 [Siganus canaliculatus]
MNPFSFREFLRWKNLDPEQDLVQDTDTKGLLDAGVVTFDPEVRTGFFSDPSLGPQEAEDDWGRSFQSGVDSTSSLYTEEEEEEETRFSSKPEGAAENYEGDDETSMAEPVTPHRRRSGRSLVQELKEENVSLRRTMQELQRRSEASEHRVSQLMEELLQRRRQEEKEAQDLEAMVHSVEQNLHLMTKRAMKAEQSVCRLKAELQQLQVEAESLRSENVSLKATESEVVMAMRHNARVASEDLARIASSAQSSIRQLLGEAETLTLVSQLLQSIDKISDITPES